MLYEWMYYYKNCNRREPERKEVLTFMTLEYKDKMTNKKINKQWPLTCWPEGELLLVRLF
jgi:hypothetical protein